MTQFSLTTIWRIPAPADKIWAVLLDTEKWPVWWKYVKKVEQLSPGEKSGLNNIRRYYWATCLPYQLVLDLCITRLEPCQLIVTRVSGDLQGVGSCQFSIDHNMTTLRYEWNVDLCKPWMTWLAPVARPVFIWNHQRVMKEGEESLIRRLEESD